MGCSNCLGKPVVRIHTALAALVGLGLLCVGIVASGRQLKQSETGIELDDLSNMDVPDLQEAEVGEIDSATGLERIDPRPPLSDLAAPQKPVPPASTFQERWRPVRVFNPVATAAGEIIADGYRIVFEGLEPTAADARCSSSQGDWPCGARARTEFRQWLRGRALMCRLPPQPGAEKVSTDCRVGADDPAQWLVANGWAEATANGALSALGEQAKSSAVGVFGPPPARVGASILPGSSPELILPDQKVE